MNGLDIRVAKVQESKDLAESIRRDIETRGMRVVLDPGQPAPSLGDSIAIVVSGSMVLSHSEAESVPVRIGPGGFFGDSYPGIGELKVTATAETPAELAVLSWNSLPEGLREQVKREIRHHVLTIDLGSIAMFRELDSEALAQLAAESDCVALARGDRLILEGEDADCFYVVLRGSLEIYRRKADGGTQLIDVIGPGACVGEMALLLRDKRSASVRARRHSVVVRVYAKSFELLKQQASIVLHIARTLSGRLKQTTASTFSGPGIEIMALLPFCDATSFQDFISGLTRAFEKSGNRIAVIGPPASMRADQFAAWFSQRSAGHDYTACVCAEDHPEWKEWAILQADLILCAGSQDAQPLRRLPPEVKEARNAGAQVELALLRATNQTPHGTEEWLKRGPFDAHHHVASSNDADFDRLVRRISGKAWGLVLGGGGARGMAHIGVIRAFEEAGIPIDMIGGSSMGAILAAQYASGLDSAQMLEITRESYTGGSSFADMTLPLVSMRTGGGTIARLRSIFGERNIEDLPIPYFCATCNLTRATTVIQDRGPLALWTRVSCSVPGLLPPLPWNGDLLVDGALLENLPVAAMRQRMRGHVAASDVSVSVDLAVNVDLQADPSWSGVGQMYRKILGRPAMPNIGSLLMRTAEIASIRDARVAGRPVDIYLHVPVDEFSMSDFHAIDNIVALGYSYTAAYLREWKARQP